MIEDPPSRACAPRSVRSPPGAAAASPGELTWFQRARPRWTSAILEAKPVALWPLLTQCYAKEKEEEKKRNLDTSRGRNGCFPPWVSPICGFLLVR